MTFLVLDLPDRALTHLTHALTQHERWWRGEAGGGPLPPELTQLLAGLRVRLAQDDPKGAPGPLARDSLAVSIDVAAELLGMSRSSVKRRLADGRLTSVKVGRRRLIPRAALAELLAGHDEGAAG